MAISITREQVNILFRIALLANSALAIFSVVIFFLSNWWIFLVLGTLGLPFSAGAVFLYKYTSLRGPMKKYAVNWVVALYNGIVQKRGFLLKRVYTAALWFVPRNEWKHINWGYATLHENGELLSNLEEADQEKRFYVQLYHYLATGMGNWNTLEGKNVLELRSGGGGGLAYLESYLNPAQCIGVDEAADGIQYSREHYGQNPKMKFYAADKLDEVSNLDELRGERIDIALSVQSSKNVIDFPKFIQSVSSVLKPGGVFVFSDLRPSEDWTQVEAALEGSSMRILKKEDISKNVANALKIDEHDKWNIIHRRFGSMLRLIATRAGVVKDSALRGALKNGSSHAMAYILHKPSNVPVQAGY